MFRKILKVLTAAGVVLYVIGKIMTKQENLRGALLGTLGFFIALGCGLILFFLWAYGKLFKVSKSMITEAINDANGGEPKNAAVPMRKGRMAEKAKEKLGIAPPLKSSSSDEYTVLPRKAQAYATQSDVQADADMDLDINEVQLTRNEGRQCANCGALLDDDDDFCPECGAQYIPPKKKICIKCGEELDADEDFCPYCGQKYIDPDLRICRNCGSKVKPRASFCGKCGTKYEEEA